VRATRLVREDLLRAERQLGRLLGGERERLVVAVGVQRLRAAEYGGERLRRHAHHVVQRLLRGERRAARLRVEAQTAGLVGGAEPLAHERAQSRRAARNLATSSKRSLCAAKKKESRGANVLERRAGGQRPLHVLEPVGEGERDLLRRRRPASRMW
jgi:hypothetical protein